MRRFAAAGLALLIGSAGAFAQSGTPAPQDQSGKPPANAADANKDNQRKADEFVEASQAINGPAGNPECVWLGRRVVRLMWRDDLDTAFRHLDLYDRFGCPGGLGKTNSVEEIAAAVEAVGQGTEVFSLHHQRAVRAELGALIRRAETELIQTAIGSLPLLFQEVILLADIEEMKYQEVAETLDSRIHVCWINPGAQPQAAAAGPAPATAGNAAPAPAASPSPAPSASPAPPAK